ncbi:MAG: MFS transporter [Proteobacteria bacterium]|nr:MFS transporter [Pseudomonadota bacterium]
MEHHSELKGKAILFLLLLWFLWFINFSTRTIFSPILPLIEDEFLISHAGASSIFIFQSIGYGLSMLFSGFYSGRIGYRKSIAFSLVISSFTFSLIPFVKVFSVLYIYSFILGFSAGVYLPSAIPLITEFFAEKNWGRSIAIHDSGASVSIFSAPFIALFFLQYFQWRWIFEVFAVVFILSAIVFYLICDEVKIRHASQKTLIGDLIKIRSLWIISILFTFAAGVNLGIYFIVPLYLTKELSLSIGYANTILGISRLGGIGVAILCGFLVDRFSLRKTIFIMMLLTGIFTICTGVSSVKFLGFFLFLQAICITGFFPLGLLSIARIFNREMRGMATGLVMTLSIMLGGGLIPYLLGLSGDFLSFRFGITTIGILVILSSPIIFYLKEIK